jgi:hypothetical protein
MLIGVIEVHGLGPNNQVDGQEEVLFKTVGRAHPTGNPTMLVSSAPATVNGGRPAQVNLGMIAKERCR